MKLANALRLTRPGCIAFTGAGGKTTAMFQLARELLALYNPVPGQVIGFNPGCVLVTATTHLHVLQTSLADIHLVINSPQELGEPDEKWRGIVLVTGSREGERTTGVDDATLARLHEISTDLHLPLLIEADGSRQRSLKAPGDHEPVVPAFVDMVVVTAGMLGVGEPLAGDHVHRPIIYSKLSGLSLDTPVTLEGMARVLQHLEGGLKGIPASARRVLLLNQADSILLQGQARSLVDLCQDSYDSIIIASLQQKLILSISEPVAGILLAAGGSRRFGKPKQLLDWHGATFVRKIAETALKSGLSELIVVTGAYGEDVTNEIKDLPVKIAPNTRWEDGQSSSIKTGLNSVNANTGSVIFLLVDQPQVTEPLIRALVERHSLNLSAIVAPQVMGDRTNPVLFDRSCFTDLQNIQGDLGGRVLFSKFPVTYLPWHDGSLLSDIDTPEDYDQVMDRN